MNEYFVTFEVSKKLKEKGFKEKGNEHLLGKTDNCNKYYKNWE